MRKITHISKLPVIFDPYDKDLGLVCLGLTIRVGSVSETPCNNGAAHFIEHLVFKGSKNYSLKEITEEVEKAGGIINAYTTKEYTTFYIKGFSGSIKTYLKVLFDMVYNPLFLEDELELEREVVLNEISGIFDVPDDYLAEEAERLFYKPSSLALPIAGTEDSVSDISKNELINFHKKFYTPQNSILSVSGCFDTEEVNKTLADMLQATHNGKAYPQETKAETNTFKDFITHQTEQSYAVIFWPSFGLIDQRRYELTGLHLVFGGLMSSRLFRKLREEMGLCYSIDSDPVMQAESGYLGVFLSTRKKNLDLSIELILKEAEKLKKTGISHDEDIMVKNQMLFSHYSSLSGLTNRMTANMKQFFYLGKLIEPAESIKNIESVTSLSIMNMADKIFSSEASICTLST